MANMGKHANQDNKVPQRTVINTFQRVPKREYLNDFQLVKM